MGIFSSLFGRETVFLNNDVVDNPWAGLSSYEDPEKAEREGRKPKLFCGRDEESHNVAQLIVGNIFVTLYGKSGTGKTSLLNAGVFPHLRQKRYLPLSIRLSMDAMDISFQQCIIHQLTQAIINKQGTFETVNVVPLPEDEQQPDFLWCFFARTKFLDNDGRTLFPIIVFDQFEEVFRDRREEAEVLLRQIAYMMDESHALSSRIVDNRPYKYDFNFRFVTSIREDDLYRLEDSIDNCYLPELKRCRYRLRSLTEQGANDVILIPGEGLFKDDEQGEIAKRIIDKSRNEDGSISTNIISLLCSRIFVDYIRTGSAHITRSLVDSFIKGNPFERFYNEATQGFSNDEKSFIEDHFVDSTGRRNSMPESDFLLHVKNGIILLDGEHKILQRTSTSTDGGNFRIELIHDSFCKPLEGQRQQRIQRKRVKQIVFISTLALLIIGGSAYIIHSMYERQQRMLINQSRFLSEKVFTLIDEGDTCTAQLLALEALPKQLDHPDRPYTVEAEGALRKTCPNKNAIIYRQTSYINSVSFSPDGKRIVSASNDETIRIWDVQTGRQIGEPLRGHTGYVKYASFSPDGERIVSASSWDNTVRIWNAQTGRQIDFYKGNFASFSPDGRFIVSASGDRTIRIWDIWSGNQIGESLKGHSDYVKSASFSPDGKCIVSASGDKTIRIWDVQTGRQIGEPLRGHTNSVNYASFSSDGKCIVSASDDKTIRIWDVQTGRQIGEPLCGHANSVNYASFSPDGKRIVSASRDETVRIWDVQTGRQIESIDGHFASFSPDGKRIVSASEANTFLIWDVQTGKQKQFGGPFLGHVCPVETASFSPDGKRIVSASNDETIRIWDVQTGKQIGEPLHGHTDNVYSVFFSPDGKRIVSASCDKTIRIWDVQTGRQIGRPLQGHSDAVISASFSSDGKRIVSASWDCTVCIWNVQTGRQIGEPLRGHIDYVNFASYSPDDKRIVSASEDGTIRIWDAQTGRQIGEPLRGHTSGVRYVSYSRDGKYVVSASADSTVRIWDVQTCRQIGEPLQGHTDAVCSATFSPDGKRIVSASDDKTIRIWDVQTGRQIGEPLQGHALSVNSAFFSPNGNHIVSASDDKSICIWDFPPLQQIINETRERFKDRQLTPEELRRYYLE